MELLRRWAADENGQDLVEYVLLGTTIGLAAIVAMNVFGGVINSVYTSWESANYSLWEPQDPAPAP
jgi:Flp pilus assembly pilin Flp